MKELGLRVKITVHQRVLNRRCGLEFAVNKYFLLQTPILSIRNLFLDYPPKLLIFEHFVSVFSNHNSIPHFLLTMYSHSDLLSTLLVVLMVQNI